MGASVQRDAAGNNAVAVGDIHSLVVEVPVVVALQSDELVFPSVGSVSNPERTVNILGAPVSILGFQIATLLR